MKKIYSVFLTLLIFLLPVTVLQAQENDVLSFGWISIAMPEISVEVKGTGYAKDSISASLDTESLDVVDAAPYDRSVHTTCVYILVDLSTSMRSSFSLVKENIICFLESLGERDRVILLTFGETTVNKVLTGEEDRNTAINAVQNLTCNENGTLFYEALSQAYQLSTASISEFDREYALAFSDGIDLQRGNTTFNEVLQQYSSHALPLYAACSSNASNDAADRFGEMARASGGSFSLIASQSDFQTFLSEINDVTLIQLRASSNYADGKTKQLSMQIGSLQSEYNVPVTRSIPDTVAPVVEQLYYDTKKDVFVLTFSEKVDGALSAQSYRAVDPNGNSVAVSNVYYSEEENAYELQLENPVISGGYTFEFSGITDSSMERNSLTGSQSVLVESVAAGLPVWAIMAIAAAVLLFLATAAGLIVFLSRRKPAAQTADSSRLPEKAPPEVVEHFQPVPSEVKHHIIADPAVQIGLKIKTGNTAEQNIAINVVSSLIIGRSDTCDIYIDDTKLSRQHFVIENDNGNLYVMDLQSRNGTMLNGIRINSRQPLQSGDKITVGLSDIIVTFIRR